MKNRRKFEIITVLSMTLILSACLLSKETQEITEIYITEGDHTELISVLKGTNIEKVLIDNGISIGVLDSISPPLTTIIDQELEIFIIRGSESVETIQTIIPYDRQELPNESMSAGDTRLIQAGKNGLLEQKIKHVYQDGKEVSSAIISEEIIIRAENEIVMVGILSPFQTISIPGRLVYINNGNAWLIENTTFNRIPLITTGDLDGRIFSLSPDGKWLLFSRSSPHHLGEEINNLWIINLNNPTLLVDLHISNVIHFADWQPGEDYVISYSTVEPRDEPPGWQANNNLFSLQIDPDTGEPGLQSMIIDSSSGGIYGWWGTAFVWSPDGSTLAYSQPDSIGLVDVENGNYTKVISITPYTSFSDWAWIPGISWSSDGDIIFFVSHSIEPGIVSQEISPIFDLMAYLLPTKQTILLVSDIGMFSYPISSTSGGDHLAKNPSLIGFLNAIFPRQSDQSHYRVNIVDRDGSEVRNLFPEETSTGIYPQKYWGAWAPDTGSSLLAILYEGNLWILDALTGITTQITGDGLTNRLDWK